MNNNDERANIGKPCKICGHAAGAHESLAGQELDEASAGDECRFESCSCPGFVDINNNK